jgi:hypothetical protein
MKIVLENLRKLLVYGIWFGGITLVFFVPTEFHDNIRVGIIPLLSFLYMDGEGMSPGGYLWHGYQVHFLILPFLISVLLWSFSLVAVYKWLKYLDSESYLK